MEAKKYDDALTGIATTLAMKYFAIVNFVCLPYDEFLENEVTNFIFIFKGNGTFTPEDYQKIARAEQIRNASDYDYFYVASKEEARQQVENADYIVTKIEKYINDQNV